ncbi:hypothetical protein GALMADRAFT_143922 [Galerina marginata CBS 339.88]|uniref:F-box domain-containing protein n=1 Tax=Galerina marginata (strain CBS 339.88) TaxID=685588 RepID=A0A067SJR8_GALM3|nr:hypothetical protein GALMADRAFT_143922 [Galerina marginata CBS 339.88]
MDAAAIDVSVDNGEFIIPSAKQTTPGNTCSLSAPLPSVKVVGQGAINLATSTREDRRVDMDELTVISIGKQSNYPAPIFRLDDDTLGHVFALNADMELKTEDEIPSLFSLLHTSQVCSIWRNFTLASPWLWARVLNISILRQTRHEWRTEIIRRTGSALLHIKSVNRLGEGRDKVSEDFLESILNKNWTRIRSLHLHLNIRTVDDRWGSIFLRSAPSLEAFRFSWPETLGEEQNLASPDFILFSNTAPLLRTLSVANVTQNLATLSISNLRYLVLHPSVSAHELLSSLRSTPLLESLEASVTKVTPVLRESVIRPRLPPVSLPQLKDIKFKIYHAIDATLSLLAHLKPASRCALLFKGSYYHETPSRESVRLYSEVLSTYSKCYPNFETATNLVVTFESDCASLAVKSHSRRHFKFHVYNGAGFHQDIFSTFLSSFKVYQLDIFKTLKLSVEPIEPIVSNTDLQKFILSLISVEVLDTTHQTLDYIHKLQCNSVILVFPALKTIHLNYIHRPNEVSLIINFLNSRMTREFSGEPVTLIMGAGVTADLTTLKVFPRVILKTVARTSGRTSTPQNGWNLRSKCG